MMDHCPLCYNKNIELKLNTKDYAITGENFHLYRCADCGVTFTHNPPVENNSDKYYTSINYISHSDIKEGLLNKSYHFAREIMLKKKRRLIEKLTPKKKLLDIGCGTGYFLNYMKKYSYEVLGIEKNRAAKEFAVKKFNLKVRLPEDLLNGTIKEQFDIITLWHVLEHLYNPQIYLKKIHELLHDDGILLIALPNHRSFDAAYYKDKWAAYDVPRHLWHFTPETLISFAEKFKFKIKALKGLRFDPFYNSLLSAKYKSKYLYLFSGMTIGILSFFIGLFNTKKCSSIVFILKKIRQD